MIVNRFEDTNLALSASVKSLPSLISIRSVRGHLLAIWIAVQVAYINAGQPANCSLALKIAVQLATVCTSIPRPLPKHKMFMRPTSARYW